MDFLKNHYQKGLSAFESKNFDLAIEEFTKAIIKDNLDKQAYYSRGYVFYVTKKFDKAIADFNNVTKLDTNYASAYFMKGCTYDEQNNYLAAIEEYNKAISINYKDVDYYVNRGLTYYKLLKFTDAISDWKFAISLNPQLSSELNPLIEKAEVASFFSTELVPSFSVTVDKNKSIELCNIGINEKRRGNYQEALNYYNKAKLYDILNANIYYNKAKILIGLGKFKEGFINLLIYYHLNLLGPDYKSEISFMFYDNYLNTKFYWEKSNLTTNLNIEPNIIKHICEQIPATKYLVVDINLSFYAGICFIGENEDIRKFNNISLQYIQNIQNGLLGRIDKYNNDLRNTPIENLFNYVGFLYSFINTNLNVNVQMNVEQFYFNEDYIILKDINNIANYIKSITNKQAESNDSDLPF